MAGKEKEPSRKEILRMYEKRRGDFYSYELFFFGMVFAIVAAFFSEAVYDYFIIGDETSISFEFLALITLAFLLLMLFAFQKFRALKRDVDRLAQYASRKK